MGGVKCRRYQERAHSKHEFYYVRNTEVVDFDQIKMRHRKGQRRTGRFPTTQKPAAMRDGEIPFSLLAGRLLSIY